MSEERFIIHRPKDHENKIQTFPENVRTLADFEGVPIEPRRWIVDGVVPEACVMTWGGPPGAGKSLCTQQLCMCVAAGQNFLGIPTEASPTLYVTCEDEEDELRRRADAIRTHLGVTNVDLSDFHFSSWVGDPDTVLQGKKLFELKTVIEENHIRLLVLDLIPDFWIGNEIVRSEVNAFMKGTLGTLAAQTRCTVIGVHHPSKAGMADKSGTSGSTSWEGSVRQRIYLTGEDENGIRCLEVKKSNYGVKGEVANVRWQSVGEHSGVLVATDDIRISEPKKLGKHERPFLNLIPDEGISGERLRDIWREQNRPRQEYFRARDSLLRDKQMKEENGVLYRLVPTP